MSAVDARRPVTPVVDVIIGGFCSSAAGYEELRGAMQRASGNTTVYIGMTRFGLPFFKTDMRYPRYPRPLYRQALHVMRTLRRKYKGHAFRLYGHSMGGAVALIAAESFGPTMGIKRVVALNPAGMYNDGVIALAKRMVRKGQSDDHNSKHHPSLQVRRIIKAGKPGFFMYLANPIRSLMEGLALARTPLFTQVMPRLEGRDMEVMVGYSDGDIVFVPDRMVEALKAFPGIEAFELENTLHDMQYTPTNTVNAMCRHGAL